MWSRKGVKTGSVQWPPHVLAWDHMYEENNIVGEQRSHGDAS
jgi:hypothetical protein